MLFCVENVGELIRRVRKETGITQAELARLVRTKQSAIARIETGASNPTFRTVAHLLAAMGKSLSLNARPIEASETGVDPTLIYENLRLSPADRLRNVKAHAEFVRKLHSAKKVAA